MSSDEQDRRKTLTVKKTARDAHAAADDTQRKRSGARARTASLIERAKDQAQRLRGEPASDPATSRDTAVRGRGKPGSRTSDEFRSPRRESGKPDTLRRQRRESAPPGEARPQRRDSAAPGESQQKRHESAAPDKFHERRRQAPEPDAFVDHDDFPAETEWVPEPDVQRRAPRALREAEIFEVFAPCPQGLEEALTAEMQALGFTDAQAGRAGCHFSTDWPGVQRANLYSRLATRILVQVAHEEISHEDDILDLAYSVPWERWFGAEHTLRVDTSAIKSPVQSLHYCNLRAKDGICDRLRDREGERPSIDTVRPDARVHLFLTGHTATLYLDTSGESLFKRGWRLDKGEAPLRENLAAGMLALAGWDPAAALLDPFCGSGTILIEAAWIALGVPAGISRPLGFERLRGHDPHRWHDLKDDARARILPGLDAPLVGYDLDPQAIEFARNNAERAWLTPDTIRFEVGDAREVPAPAERGWIVTNPPYGERLPADETELWRAWSANLKRSFAGWQLHVISSDRDLPQRLRLKPLRRTPLHNGALDCRLFGFELVAAGYRDPV
ncbi:THUMP domain-containing protein [Bordetella tumulicola]|uniref:THUMP domain-containing protein n=1 Tax=Bordetella tumulicola TaxID=1649133 RepID=UPI0039F08CD6